MLLLTCFGHVQTSNKSLNFSHVDATRKCSQDHSFLVLSFLVLLYTDLNILISVILIWLDAPESRNQVEDDGEVPERPKAERALTIICCTNSGVRENEDLDCEGADVEADISEEAT